MAEPRSETRSPAPAGRFPRLRDSGEVILVALSTLLGMLWAIVLVTHFNGTLSSVGQWLWLTR
ncbi:hypothetical protein ASF49_09780 [Methylobacterium sp. Leaf104]|uniref:hypothetical protein n=1 Tax=Methylobacterium TaxID=407 RepID=UPI0006FCC24E|nr:MULTISPECIES: hypothetical protein [Methylobacterium]KQP31721.1 hypothetical protein ASF49_09780 [Methylobacterium sp. Leaf104]MCI9880633.1 hypothetical protein [Methylobacterium goesingense]